MTAYERRISDWTSDVCSSDRALRVRQVVTQRRDHAIEPNQHFTTGGCRTTELRCDGTGLQLRPLAAARVVSDIDVAAQTVDQRALVTVRQHAEVRAFVRRSLLGPGHAAIGRAR